MMDSRKVERAFAAAINYKHKRSPENKKPAEVKAIKKTLKENLFPKDFSLALETDQQITLEQMLDNDELNEVLYTATTNNKYSSENTKPIKPKKLWEENLFPEDYSPAPKTSPQIILERLFNDEPNEVLYNGIDTTRSIEDKKSIEPKTIKKLLEENLFPKDPSLAPKTGQQIILEQMFDDVPYEILYAVEKINISSTGNYVYGLVPVVRSELQTPSSEYNPAVGYDACVHLLLMGQWDTQTAENIAAWINKENHTRVVITASEQWQEVVESPILQETNPMVPGGKKGYLPFNIFGITSFEEPFGIRKGFFAKEDSLEKKGSPVLRSSSPLVSAIHDEDSNDFSPNISPRKNTPRRIENIFSNNFNPSGERVALEPQERPSRFRDSFISLLRTFKQNLTSWLNRLINSLPFVSSAASTNPSLPIEMLSFENTDDLSAIKRSSPKPLQGPSVDFPERLLFGLDSLRSSSRSLSDPSTHSPASKRWRSSSASTLELTEAGTPTSTVHSELSHSNYDSSDYYPSPLTPGLNRTYPPSSRTPSSFTLGTDIPRSDSPLQLF